MTADSQENLGPYQVTSRLGAGGMGEVFLAYDPRLDRQVAIKRIRTDGGHETERRSRLQREAKVAAGLVHSAIVQIFDLLTLGEVDHIVMEYVPGTSLRRALDAGPLPLPEGLAIACAVADGLAYAHQKGVIHRDLKSENVLISPEGEAKIADFGIARRLAAAGESTGETLTRDGAVMGTFRSMSPEQACGDPLDARTDLFSFGVLLYETFTGESPFLADSNARTVERLFNHRPPPARQRAPGLPPSLSDLIDHLLAKEPGLRPRDALEVAERLHAIEQAVRHESEATMVAGATGSTGKAVPAPAPAPAHTEVTQTIRTLMVTDLVASTELMSRLGDRRAMELGARHDHMARALVARHGGREIDKSDGFLLLFDRPIEAVHCALDYHAALEEMSAQESVELSARAGIHLGEVFLRENPPEDVRRGAKPLEVEGLAKATVARVAELAGSGQTLLTRGAFDLAQRAAADDDPGEAPLRFISHGPYRFQGVEETVEVCEVGIERHSPLRAPDAVAKAVPVVPDSGTWGGPRRRGWIAAAVVAALAIAMAAGIRLWPPSPPLYVAVLEPEIQTGPNSDPEETASLAYAARLSLQRAMSGLEGVSPKALVEIDYVTGAPMDVARAVGADELIAARLACRGRVCEVDLSRVLANDGSLIDTRKVSISVDDPATASKAIGVGLRALFPGHEPRPGMGRFEVTPDDYASYLEIQKSFDSRGPTLPISALLDQVEAIQQSSASFVDAYLLEAEISGREFNDTEDQEQLKRALAALDHAQYLAPGDPDVLFMRVWVETTGHLLDSAEATLAALEDLVPGDVRIIDRRAMLFSSRGEAAKALELYKNASELRPSWPRLLNYARNARRQGKTDVARNSLLKLLAHAPDNYRGLSLLALIELTAGDLSRATELYLALGELRPRQLNNLGVAYMLLGDYDAAETTLEQVVRLAPQSPSYLLNLADVRLLQGHSEAAEHLYSRVVELTADGASVTTIQDLTVRAQALAHIGHHREAVRAAQKALLAAPQDGNIAFEVAVVYALIGDRNSALFHAEQAIELGYQNRNWFKLPWFDGLRTDTAFAQLVAELR